MKARNLYTVEKNVPLPNSYAHDRIGKWTRLARSMSVGDSVLVASFAEAMSLRNALVRVKGSTHSATTRKECDGTRVWLVKRSGQNSSQRGGAR